ncbi:MAG: hypothetical protein ACHQC8_02015 [Solirubrobacterales bacterium]
MSTQPSRVAAMLGQPVDLLAIDTSKPRPWTPGAQRITRPGPHGSSTSSRSASATTTT